VKTDHLSLKYLQQLKLGPLRLIRYAVFFAPYNFTVQHISGEKNQLCDILSRVPYPPENENEVEPILDMHPHDFLGLIRSDELMVDDNGKEQRDPSRKRRHYLAVLALRSTTDGEQDETINESTEIPHSSDENLDAELTDEDTIFAHELTFSDLSVKVNLQTQKDDAIFRWYCKLLTNGAST
jgi:hypothetical protein